MYFLCLPKNKVAECIEPSDPWQELFHEDYLLTKDDAVAEAERVEG